MKPVVFRTPEQVMTWRNVKNGTIGFVPTMGALHKGHEALFQRARVENDVVVASIFVNPTQFNDKNDFEKYPQTWESDVAAVERNKVDVIFYPDRETIYPDNYRYKVSENEFSKILCGKNRPGHFDGVLTVVLKLLNIVRPTRAYFGEKDHQQLTLVRGMVDAFFLNCEITGLPTIREADGLALSSRNVRLTPADRARSPALYKALSEARNPSDVRFQLENRGFEVDYVEDWHGRRYVAARLGEVRLIDNIEI